MSFFKKLGLFGAALICLPLAFSQIQKTQIESIASALSARNLEKAVQFKPCGSEETPGSLGRGCSGRTRSTWLASAPETVRRSCALDARAEPESLRDRVDLGRLERNHTAVSRALTSEHLENFAEREAMEFVLIDRDTKVGDFKKKTGVLCITILRRDFEVVHGTSPTRKQRPAAHSDRRLVAGHWRWRLARQHGAAERQ